MMGNCAKCGVSVESTEIHEFAGESLCEDCYLEQRIKPITCDPWAVYAARNSSGKARQLSDLQRQILQLLREKGPLQATEICRQLNILEAQFESNFATLRHMELARGFKDGDKVFFRLF